MRYLALAFLMLPAVAAADTTQATFDVRIGGLRAGTLAIAGEENATRYAVAARMRSAGLVGALRTVRYDGTVRGRIAEGTPRPARYEESFRRGGDASAKALTYRGGVPRLTGDDGGDLDPASQGGTVDPLTAIWGLLRDVPTADACRFATPIFDGERRSRVALGPLRRDGGRIVCDGEYRRVAGYSDKDMARRTRFAFRLTYRPAGPDRWAVERLDMDTTLGRGTLIRR